MTLTQHAETRANQRGFNQEIISTIIKNGSLHIGKDGAQVFKFNQKDCNKMISELKRTIKIYQKAKNGVLIVSNNQIITMYKES